ncbi:MAG: FAD-dependent oxidoreductase, partial [Candidatus Gastranaerophilales bacterium]|nr:FAD-dependent oxidoreductase [Candidatus Gastranaerophilales bacterium]
MYDIAVLGAGSGGYTAAIRAAQLGAKVILIEKENIGGTCLNWGCIPSKATIASAEKYIQAKKLSKFGINAENISFDYSVVSKRKWSVVEKIRKNLENLIKSNNIEIVMGEGEIFSDTILKVNDREICFKKLIIATGSKCTSLGNLMPDNDFIFDTNGILLLDEIPENILIVGSGASGIEWARIFSSFGKKVVITEMANRLAPMFDVSQSERIERLFKRSRVEFYKETVISNIENKKVTLSNGKVLNPDIIMLAAGRKPNSDIKGLNVEKNKDFIKVDSNLKTSNDNFYAIGDVTGILQLAHVASHQAVA